MNIEYFHESAFKKFFEKVAQKTVAVMYDVNTKPYALQIIEKLKTYQVNIVDIYYSDVELVPTEDKCELA